jgi:type I restriction enzyme S subunit
MKDAILQYAIQGKLTQQLAEDGDARDLLKDIQKEKARLIKEGKIKKGKAPPRNHRR